MYLTSYLIDLSKLVFLLVVVIYSYIILYHTYSHINDNFFENYSSYNDGYIEHQIYTCKTDKNIFDIKELLEHKDILRTY